MSLWKIAIWAISTLGVAGTLVLLALYPAIVSTIFKGIVAFIRTELSYRIGCAITAAIITGFAVDYWRHSRDDAWYAAKAAAFQQAQIARDKAIADETRQAVWTEIANATAENAVTDNEVKEFTDALPPATGNPFRIDSADALRLCRIAGQARCGPRSAQGVPAAKGAGPGPANRGFRLPRLVRPGAGPAQKGQR